MKQNRQSVIHDAVMVALGCTKIDFRSLAKMNDAAEQIARFVEAALIESEREPEGCDCYPWPDKCPYCGEQPNVRRTT